MTKKSHVLILGGGFAGIGAAQKLARTDATLTLVDMQDHGGLGLVGVRPQTHRAD